ncbi:hypothetical protein NDU88_007000 [Pleurodeles waltl]|uniref:Complex 1 LYR protein domain-containing protein n=1 Tax=Pleurodeles waltl TaxID=8319 RepID=A0AAV7WGE2_PLEWA|nr:hypothetical protein NDU88_007000 [Pleurodeles waltl]
MHSCSRTLVSTVAATHKHAQLQPHAAMHSCSRTRGHAQPHTWPCTAAAARQHSQLKLHTSIHICSRTVACTAALRHSQVQLHASIHTCSRTVACTAAATHGYAQQQPHVAMCSCSRTRPCAAAAEAVTRKILQTACRIPNEADRRYVKEKAREEFKRNKDSTDEAVIRMMVTQGTMQLQELERSLQLAKS